VALHEALASSCRVFALLAITVNAFGSTRSETNTLGALTVYAGSVSDLASVAISALLHAASAGVTAAVPALP
jgi:hypothetical protein